MRSMRSVKNNAAALLLLLLALCCPLTAAAQSAEERVNAILINENYISGIGEGNSEQEAYQAALQDLAATVSDFRLQRGKTSVSVGDVQIHAQSLNDDVRHMMLLYLTVEKALAITPRHDSAPEAQSPIPVPSPAPAISQPATPAPASPTSPIPHFQPPILPSCSPPAAPCSSTSWGAYSTTTKGWEKLPISARQAPTARCPTAPCGDCRARLRCEGHPLSPPLISPRELRHRGAG